MLFRWSIERILLGAALLGGSLVVMPLSVANATEADFEALPALLVHGCLTCHDGPTSTAEAVASDEGSNLNSFGADWLSFGRTWSPALAAANSDQDGCKNGYELGDPTGRWTPSEDHISIPTRDQKHPGRAGDCLLPLGEESFGVLKSLFGD